MGTHSARRGAPASLARSSAVMAVGTVASRATGLIRLALQAAALSAGLLATTYNNANTVPMSLYTLLIGGALNSVLVPQLVRARAEHPDGGLAHEQRLLTLVLCVLGAGTVAAVLAAPEIASLYIGDSPGNHAAYALTVVFCRFLLPQIFFYGLFSIVGQLLNARNRFGAYSLSYLAGLLLTAGRLRRRLEGRLDGRRLARTYGKLVLAAGAAAGAARATADYAVPGRFGPSAALAAGGAAMALLFPALARALRLPELRLLPGLRRARTAS